MHGKTNAIQSKRQDAIISEYHEQLKTNFQGCILIKTGFRTLIKMADTMPPLTEGLHVQITQHRQANTHGL